MIPKTPDVNADMLTFGTNRIEIEGSDANSDFDGHLHNNNSNLPVIGFLISRLVDYNYPKLSLMTFLLLFLASFGAAWPVALRLAEWLIVRLGMKLETEQSGGLQRRELDRSPIARSDETRRACLGRVASHRLKAKPRLLVQLNSRGYIAP